MDECLPISISSGETDIRFLTLPLYVLVGALLVGVLLVGVLLVEVVSLSACSEGQSKVYETFVPTSSTLEQYQRYCSVCHTDERTGAPLAGDRQAWRERMEKGMQVLIASTIDGMADMPPLGLCFECSRDEFAALINYMSAGDFAQ